MAVKFDSIDDLLDDSFDDGKQAKLSASREVEHGDAFSFSDVDGSSESSAGGLKAILLKTAIPALVALLVGIVVGTMAGGSAAQPEAAPEDAPAQEVTLVTTKPVLDQVKSIKDSEIEMMQRQVAIAQSSDAPEVLFMVNDSSYAALNVISPFIDRIIQLRHDAPVEDLSVARDDVLPLCDYNSMASSRDLDALLTGHGVEGQLGSEVEIIGRPIASVLTYEVGIEEGASNASAAKPKTLSRMYLAYVPVATEGSTHLALYSFSLNGEYAVTSVKYLGCTSGVSDNSAVTLADAVSEMLAASAGQGSAEPPADGNDSGL